MNDRQLFFIHHSLFLPFLLARRSQKFIHSVWRCGRARAHVVALAALSCFNTFQIKGLYADMMKTDLVESSLARVRVDAEAERELTRLKSGFVNTLVHDVRLPLASILALLELFDSKLSAR